MSYDYVKDLKENLILLAILRPHVTDESMPELAQALEIVKERTRETANLLIAEYEEENGPPESEKTEKPKTGN